jgi:hypothetical protein
MALTLLVEMCYVVLLSVTACPRKAVGMAPGVRFLPCHSVLPNTITPMKMAEGIPEDIKTQLRRTLDNLVKGVRDPDKMRVACERMDSMREENRKRFGEQNIADDLIRETRDRA